MFSMNSFVITSYRSEIYAGTTVMELGFQNSMGIMAFQTEVLNPWRKKNSSNSNEGQN